MGNSSFFNNPNDYQAVDEGGEGSGFYDGPAYTEIDPVAIANSVAAAAASAAASEASHQASEDDADASAASAAAAHDSQVSAATSAANALTSEQNADASEAVALAQAGIATTQAGIATTKASEAATSAANALTSENNADTSEANALTYKNNAQTSATNAATSETNAANSASAAATSASNAAGAVQAAAGTATPQAPGTAAVGTGTKWAREDHRHAPPTFAQITSKPTSISGYGIGDTLTNTVFGRSGTVTAQAGDYTFAQIGSKPTTISGFGITDHLVYYDVTQQWSRQQYYAIGTLSDAATIGWNVLNDQKAKVTLGGNRTMSAVANAVEGATYFLWVIQDATGSRTLSWTTTGAGSFDFGTAGAPTLTTTANRADLLCFEAITIAGTLKLRFMGAQKGFS